MYILKRKNEAIDVMRRVVAMVERKFEGARVARFRCDGGGEYVGGAVQAIVASMGIELEVTPPYSHESNGVAECINRTIK